MDQSTKDVAAAELPGAHRLRLRQMSSKTRVNGTQRGHYELAVEEPANRGLAIAFAERTMAI